MIPMHSPERICSNRKASIFLTFCGIIIVLITFKEHESQISYWHRLINFQPIETKVGYVTVKSFRGRLGNQMFEFAVLFYVARQTNREVVLFNDHNAHQLEEYFSLGVRKVNKSCPCFLFNEKSLAYDFRIENLTRSENATNSQTILLYGFFQSWKYIEPVEHSIRTHLKFRNGIEVFARDILRQAIPIGWIEGRFIRVGIHSRRGDSLAMKHITNGYPTATEPYFKKAMKYFADRYKLVQFIVASDDTNWAREHITYDSQSSSINVTYFSNHSPGQDMAILSLCDHAIISVGTYGWMSAWLANGTTIYYSKTHGNESIFVKRLNRPDYYPPHWIPME